MSHLKAAMNQHEIHDILSSELGKSIRFKLKNGETRIGVPEIVTGPSSYYVHWARPHWDSNLNGDRIESVELMGQDDTLPLGLNWYETAILLKAVESGLVDTHYSHAGKRHAMTELITKLEKLQKAF